MAPKRKHRHGQAGNGLQKGIRQFPPETDLKTEMGLAFKRLKALGVRYPKKYLVRMIRKYTKEGIEYPRVLMRIGEPNIKKHSHYKEVLARTGDLLDYGCGTGDDVRHLIRDGYPREKIVGLDIDHKCLDLGYDLYRDRPKTKNIFIVSARPKLKASSFDVVYSGSVLHTMGSMKVVNSYLDTTYRSLRKGGIFFGSTLGSFKSMNKERRTTFLTKKSFRELLQKKGFKKIDIFAQFEKDPSAKKTRYWFYAVK